LHSNIHYLYIGKVCCYAVFCLMLVCSVLVCSMLVCSGLVCIMLATSRNCGKWSLSADGKPMQGKSHLMISTKRGSKQQAMMYLLGFSAIIETCLWCNCCLLLHLQLCMSTNLGTRLVGIILTILLIVCYHKLFISSLVSFKSFSCFFSNFNLVFLASSFFQIRLKNLTWHAPRIFPIFLQVFG